MRYNFTLEQTFLQSCRGQTPRTLSSSSVNRFHHTFSPPLAPPASSSPNRRPVHIKIQVRSSSSTSSLPSGLQKNLHPRGVPDPLPTLREHIQAKHCMCQLSLRLLPPSTSSYLTTTLPFFCCSRPSNTSFIADSITLCVLPSHQFPPLQGLEPFYISNHFSFCSDLLTILPLTCSHSFKFHHSMFCLRSIRVLYRAYATCPRQILMERK